MGPAWAFISRESFENGMSENAFPNLSYVILLYILQLINIFSQAAVLEFLTTDHEQLAKPCRVTGIVCRLLAPIDNPASKSENAYIMYFVLQIATFASYVQVSKLSLVDLAGSERADATGAKGERLKVCAASLHVSFFTYYLI